MENILKKAQSHSVELKKWFSLSNFEKFTNCLQNFAENQKNKNREQINLNLLFSNIKFYSGEECFNLEDKIIKDLLSELKELRELENPQKNIKEMLEQREQ